jgi:1,4-dihydroxy-2-naphthoate octaprenyltransferase
VNAHSSSAVHGVAAYLGVARGPFLVLPVVLVAAGAAAGFIDGAFSWSRTLVAFVGLLALHAAVNTLNEVSDLRTGIDLATARTPFSGGSGTLPAGGLSPRAALVFGLGCAAVGLACGLWFVSRVGPIILPLLVLGAVFVLGYTDLLARVGLGEAAAGLGLGTLPVMGTALVQGGALGPAGLAASVPAFFMTFNLLLLNEFPDEAADRAGGRRNLVLLLGRRRAAVAYVVAGLATPTAVVVAVVVGALPPTALAATLPSLLLVAPLRWALSDSSAAVPWPALGANVAWNLATNAVLAVSLALAGLL